jgi:hypothetical protein
MRLPFWNGAEHPHDWCGAPSFERPRSIVSGAPHLDGRLAVVYWQPEPSI